MNHIPVLAATALLLAACQPGNTDRRPVAATASGSVESTAQHPETMWGKGYKLSPEAELKARDASRRLSARIEERCPRSAIGEAKGCIREQLLAGFDMDGLSATRCPTQSDLGAEYDCIVIGGLFYSLALKAGGDALERFDWRDRRKSVTVAMEQIVADQVQVCLSTGSASSVDDCVMDGIAKTLGIPSDDMAECRAIADDHEQGICVGVAFGYREVLRAIDRI